MAMAAEDELPQELQLVIGEELGDQWWQLGTSLGIQDWRLASLNCVSPLCDSICKMFTTWKNGQEDRSGPGLLERLKQALKDAGRADLASSRLPNNAPRDDEWPRIFLELSNHLADEWENLAIRLGLKADEIKMIKGEPARVDVSCQGFQVIRMHFEGGGTTLQLREGLARISRSDLIRHLDVPRQQPDQPGDSADNPDRHQGPYTWRDRAEIPEPAHRAPPPCHDVPRQQPDQPVDSADNPDGTSCGHQGSYNLRDRAEIPDRTSCGHQGPYNWQDRAEIPEPAHRYVAPSPCTAPVGGSKLHERQHSGRLENVEAALVHRVDDSLPEGQ